MIGFLVAFRTARVTSAAAFGSVPKLMPPPWTFGQLILTSNHPIASSSSSFSTTSTYSPTEKPETFAITGFEKTRRIFGSSSEITRSTPGFCSPTALSIPAGVSAIRGVGFPKRGSAVVPLKLKVPSSLIS